MSFHVCRTSEVETSKLLKTLAMTIPNLSLYVINRKPAWLRAWCGSSEPSVSCRDIRPPTSPGYVMLTCLSMMWTGVGQLSRAARLLRWEVSRRTRVVRGLGLELVEVQAVTDASTGRRGPDTQRLRQLSAGHIVVSQIALLSTDTPRSTVVSSLFGIIESKRVQRYISDLSVPNISANTPSSIQQRTPINIFSLRAYSIISVRIWIHIEFLWQAGLTFICK